MGLCEFSLPWHRSSQQRRPLPAATPTAAPKVKEFAGGTTVASNQQITEIPYVVVLGSTMHCSP